MCQVSIAFFPLQSGETVCDPILGFLNFVFGKTRTLVSFVHKAFVATMQVFTDAIRVKQGSLNDSVKDTAR